MTSSREEYKQVAETYDDLLRRDDRWRYAKVWAKNPKKKETPDEAK